MDSASGAGTPSPNFDPDVYRMTVGEHLEELRWRLVLGLIGFVLVAVVCLFFGRHVTATFCQPLIGALQKYDVNPQLYFTQVSDAFMVFLKISLISAAAIASPWMLYQLWLFIAAGLYPHERKYITRFIPLSVGLLVTGMLFVYFWVLPWTLEFFLAFSMTIPLETASAQVTTAPATTQPVTVPAIPGDPAGPLPYQIWFDTTQQRLKMFYNGSIRVIPFGPQNLTAPLITLPDYIDLVIGMLLVFGLCFQLPLVILALARVGIAEVSALRQSRRYVYFILCIVAAVITPGDVITATMALMIPLILLYELGIWLAAAGGKGSSAT